jgi:hypothetical protein
VPYFICPNCRRRSIDHDRREDLTNEAVGCAHCGFGFLFELLDDYYPGPGDGIRRLRPGAQDHRRRSGSVRADGLPGRPSFSAAT